MEVWADSMFQDNKFTAYFGDCDKGIECFDKWFNYRNSTVLVLLYVKISNRWNGVTSKWINKDNVDITDKCTDVCSSVFNTNEFDLVKGLRY